MAIEQPFPLELAVGDGLALLVALARVSRDPAEAPADLRSALEDLGDPTGEIWLNLLGVSLDAGAPHDAARLSASLAALDGVELRRHLLGRYAWSWCALAGIDVIEAAAAGEEAACRALLRHPRYYGGDAATALSVLLFLDADETRRRIARAVEAGAAHLLGDAGDTTLRAAEEEARAALSTLPGLAAVERLTAGYRYVPEPEAERIVLVPHLEPAPQLVLAQHRGARVIVYRARVEPDAEARLLVLGRALSDAKRVEILGLVARGVARVPELVERTGLSRSTVHHHLSHLRDAGLVTLEGNARSYAFAPRRGAAEDVADLLGVVIGEPEATETKEER